MSLSKYDSKIHDEIIIKAFERGHGLREISALICIDESTLRDWVERSPALKKASKSALVGTNQMVIGKLLDCCMNDKNKGQLTAIIFWLTNKDKDNFQHVNKQIMELSITKPESMSDQELYNQLCDFREAQRNALFYDKVIPELPEITPIDSNQVIDNKVEIKN